jgi:hypothetical protein
MKVNILGSGIIPYVGVLAPMRDVELGEKEIRGLVNFKNLRVYDKESGYLICKRNVDQFFNKKNDQKTETVVPKKIEKVEPIPVVETFKPRLAVVVDEPVNVETPVVEDEVIATVDDEGIGDIDDPAEEDVETTSDEESTEDKPYNFKKKNKKNKH